MMSSLQITHWLGENAATPFALAGGGEAVHDLSLSVEWSANPWVSLL
jgi:hypothetical protein